ncbi:unnamed protein product [Amoebophrya sp. A25]|nr:unnamed protein product [Amoebophrya sp. A25]|eukprot:GSA25T00026217001.1
MNGLRSCRRLRTRRLHVMEIYEQKAKGVERYDQIAVYADLSRPIFSIAIISENVVAIS